MTWALLGALGAAVCYGVASVLQAMAAGRETRAERVDPRLLLRLAGQAPFVAGFGLDLLGAGLTVIALQDLPLFMVQAALSSSLAVTALVAWRVLGARLGRGEVAGVAAVGVGLVLLAAASGPEAVPQTSIAVRTSLLAGALVVAAVAVPAGRMRGPRGAVVLGGLAGAGYACASTGVRVLDRLALPGLLTNPATWAAVLGGGLSLLLFATALQRGSVTRTTAALIAVETTLPAVFGLVVLGERPRHGWAAVAVVGFLVTVGGALSLARFGEAAPEPVDGLQAVEAR